MRWLQNHGAKAALFCLQAVLFLVTRMCSSMRSGSCNRTGSPERLRAHGQSNSGRAGAGRIRSWLRKERLALQADSITLWRFRPVRPSPVSTGLLTLPESSFCKVLRQLFCLSLLVVFLAGCATGYRASIGLAWNALKLDVLTESPPSQTNAVARP